MNEPEFSSAAIYMAGRLKGVLLSPVLMIERKGVDPIRFRNPLSPLQRSERVMIGGGYVSKGIADVVKMAHGQKRGTVTPSMLARVLIAEEGVVALDPAIDPEFRWRNSASLRERRWMLAMIEAAITGEHFIPHHKAV